MFIVFCSQQMSNLVKKQYLWKLVSWASKLPKVLFSSSSFRYMYIKCHCSIITNLFVCLFVFFILAVCSALTELVVNDTNGQQIVQVGTLRIWYIIFRLARLIYMGRIGFWNIHVAVVIGRSNIYAILQLEFRSAVC